ncbi:MAG: VWA domain-containing protein [Halieaceae bacterium]
MFNIHMIKKNFIASFVCALFGISPVWADDTEIFFGDTGTGAVAPNLLFIVDTSGSMNNSVSGTGMTRMQNVQEALRTLLNNLNNVNVGMMRFSNPGGPVLYQVDYIDRNVNQTIAGFTDVTTILSDNNDDAQQVADTGGMVVDGQRLEMVTMTVGSAATLTREVQSDALDDAEEMTWMTSGDNVLRGNADLEFTHDDGNASRLHVIGLRFAGTLVPDGATITNAFITMKVDNVGAGGVAEMVITGESGESLVFADLYNNISSRTRTASSVNWDLDNPAGNSFVVSPSLTPIVQDIVDHVDWQGDGTNVSDMTFIFERRSGSTSVAEHDLQSAGRGDFSPTLTVEYYVGPPPSQKVGLTGLRFQGVNVPKGVTVSSAYIDFTVGQTDSGEATSLAIYGESNDSPAAFSTSNKISTRTKTTAYSKWDSIESWDTSNQTKTTPDLKDVVQEIVNLTDWCGGDDMAFIIEGTEGLRQAWAREANNGLQPVLRVQYDDSTVVPGSSCARATLSRQITNTMDDVEEKGTEISTTSSDYDFDSSTNHVGLRFADLNLPESTTIEEAYIEFVAKYDYSGGATIKIEVENTGDAAPFTSSNGTVDDRSWGTSTNWTFSNNWVDVQTYRTSDIKDLVQAAVNHTSWSLGNDMAFRVSRTSGSSYRADTFDRDPVRAPRLVVKFLDDGTETDIRLVRDELLEVVDGLNTQGYTPIQDTLYEAALYYTGGDVDYGRKRGGPNDGGPHAYTRVSVAESMVDGSYAFDRPSGCSEDNLGAWACHDEEIDGSGGGNPQYKTPINDWCQKNSHIILLTDGQANRPHSQTKIDTFIGSETCDNSGLTNSGEYCVKDLVEYLNTEDQSPLKEKQVITTHTIGFNFSSQWLADVAAAGGGQYKEATQASDLVDEIENILTEVLKTNSSFVAPVAAINQFNRLNHRAEIYFAVFRPDDTPSWPGNLKKYRLRASDNAVIDFSSTAGVEAINAQTGFFTDTAQSAWGGVADGPEVQLGGANSKMPLYSSRNVYTYYAGSASDNLSNAANALSNSNTNLTKAMFNTTGMSDTEFDAHIDWVTGKDVDDEDEDSVTAENRYIIGDPLHSKPIAVTYGGTEANPDITVFFGTNSGALEAVNSGTGVEQFAFIPEDKLDDQIVLRNNSSTQEHLYGIDGSVTPWVSDANGNGTISGTDEFVRIYFGQRRGGRNYYALDVTDRDNPTVMWQITGGSGDFAELGETWSQPVLGNIDIDGTATDVLYFAGGYDPDQDDTAIRAADDMGRAIFIVNAVTGDLIWKGGNGTSFNEDYDEMLYSIPADLSVVDITSSGQDNMIFVGDMGGQVWRFDINNGAQIDDLITGGVIADLGVAEATNDADINRRFYHGPDVALIYDSGSTELAVTIGSGYQAHPLSTATSDRFYMLRQTDVFTIPSTYTKLFESDLYDATDNDVGEGVSGAVSLLDAAKGWFFDMPRNGEKILSTPLTFKNTVTFTTYEPNPAAATSRCSPAAGVSRVYQVNLVDASPVNEWDDITGLTEDDRGVTLQSSSIIDEPVIVCTGAGCDMFVGAEKPPVDTPNTDRIVKTFWRKN